MLETQLFTLLFKALQKKQREKKSSINELLMPHQIFRRFANFFPSDGELSSKIQTHLSPGCVS